MRRSRLIPRDESGKPRRFHGHGAAMWWVLSRVGVFFIGIAAFGIVRALFEGPDSRFGFWVPASIVVSWLVIGLAVCASVYAYIALAGGIMRREERDRRERESR